MAPIVKTLTFGQRYNDRARNPLGADADEVAEALRIIYAEWRAEDSAPKNTDLEEDILADFSLPIGAVGVFDADGSSPTGRLKLFHGFERYTVSVGRVDPDRKVNFCMEGGVDGTDVFTVAFDPNKLELTPYVNVPLNFARHLTLLEANPSEKVLAPYKDDDAAIRTIRSRTAMFVPFELVTCLLGKDYTASEAFELCCPVLEAEGL
jgi:hypothetical protein